MRNDYRNPGETLASPLRQSIWITKRPPDASRPAVSFFNKWYKRLKKLDVRAYEATTAEEAAAIREELRVMDKMVMETMVPLSCSDAVYSLRIRMHLLRTMKDKFGDAA